MGLFGSSGIRRIVDKEFLNLAFEAGLAAGDKYKTVVVGSDTRTSSASMQNAFTSGLLAAGASAFVGGIAPTPSIGYAARCFHAGAMITASHNPPEYNGIKLLNKDGSAFDATQRKELEQAITSKSSHMAAWHEFGNSTDYPRVIGDHLDAVLSRVSGPFRLKIVVDCCCGAACEITPELLRRLGCEVLTVNCEPSGIFPRPIEPIPENLGDLAKTVVAQNADLGIAHDGDADRIAVIDEEGNFVPADKLMALFALNLGARRVVTTVDASMLIDELGFEVARTRVGDAFVSDELRKSPEKSAEQEFGAESSGCFIFPGISLCPDGIFAAAKVAEMASRDPISRLAAGIPSYPIMRGNIPGGTIALQELQDRLQNRMPSEARLENTDGIRMALRDGWLLIRPSGTEPKVRITSEAKNEARARELYDFGLELVRESFNEQERSR